MDPAATEIEHNKAAIIASVCGVSQGRARELLDAASGTVERAVEIHFDANNNITVVRAKQEEEDGKPYGVTNKKSTGTKRQSTLDAFVGLPTPTKEKKGPKQRKMDSFLIKKATAADPICIESDEGEAEKAEDPDFCRLHKPSHNQQSSNFQKEHPEIKTDSCAEKAATTGKEYTFAVTSVKSPPTVHIKKSPQVLKNTRLPYSLLTDRFAEMVSTTKRNDKLEHLRSIFKEVIASVGGVHMDGPRDEDALILTQVIDLILGKLSVTKDVTRGNITLQVSGSAVSQAIRTVTGAKGERMRQEYRRLGDLGDVASEFFVGTSVKSFFTSTETRSHSIREVHDLIQRVATTPPGEGSTAARQNLLLRLLRGCKDKNQIRFLVRTLLGNMRLGATLKSVIVALATAVSSIKEEEEEADINVSQTLQHIFNVCPSILDISKALLEGGVSRAFQVCKLVVNFPIQPMLANPAHSLDEVEKFMGSESGVAEWKYDGVRCQAHFDGKNVTLFSRHLIDNTTQYPDAVKYFLEAKKSDVQSFICDAEVVAVVPSADAEDGHRFLPFQDLSTRRGAKDSTISIRIYSYDLLYLNGRSLLQEPLWKRQELLQNHFSSTPGFGFASSVYLPTYDEVILQNALKAAVAGGAEGLMIKLTGRQPPQTECDRSFGYESGTRSKLWLKLKKDYVQGSADTIDVVPIGAWFGNGRKAQAGFLSPVLLAVYDEDDDVFRSISRCMTFSDDMYRAFREFYFRGTPYPPDVGMSNDEIPETTTEAEREDGAGEDPPGIQDDVGDEKGDTVDDRVNCYLSRPTKETYMTNETPPIWFKPLEVWEVSFADLTLSRVHTAAAGLVEDEQGRGVAMRFPRFIRRRPDKTVEMATSTVQIAQLFASQSKIAGSGPKF